MGPGGFREFCFSSRLRKVMYGHVVVRKIRGASKWGGAAIALFCLYPFGCSTSGEHPASKRDGGVDASSERSARADRPVADGASPDGGCGAHARAKDNGLSCACAAECKSNFCVDGVCC